MKAASFRFHHAEKFNRKSTALAAYWLARAQGMTHDAAYDDAYTSHFDYAAGNRARIIQGDVACVLLLFKQYGQNMIYTFARKALRAFLHGRQAAQEDDRRATGDAQLGGATIPAGAAGSAGATLPMLVVSVPTRCRCG